MAGHSKWANIKHKKAANDKKRAKVWTKLLREVTVAARGTGGGDLDANSRLRLAVDKANGANVPKDTTERAIRRGAGDDESDNYDEIRYEGYGVGGTAVIVDCMTDNRNRTASEVRHAFTKHGGNLGTSGSVAYMFEKKGIISFAPGTNEETLMDAALEAGAEDVVTHDDDSIDVLTTPEDFEAVKNTLAEADFPSDHAEITYEAETKAELDEEAAEKFMRMIDTLEDLDDVQDVYSNADISSEILDKLA